MGSRMPMTCLSGSKCCGPMLRVMLVAVRMDGLMVGCAWLFPQMRIGRAPAGHSRENVPHIGRAGESSRLSIGQIELAEALEQIATDLFTHTGGNYEVRARQSAPCSETAV